MNWVIHDPVSDKYYNIAESDQQLLKFFDKAQPVDTLIYRITNSGKETDQQHIAMLARFLEQSNLLMASYGSTEKRIAQFKLAKKNSRGIRMLSGYLFFKIPLFKPDNFLTKTYPAISVIFNKWSLLIMSIISVIGYMKVVSNWSRFASTIMGTLNYSGLFKYSILIMILKLFHEMAHAYVAKSAGVRVRRFGIGFICFMPRLYTDLTDAWKLSNRNMRALIDAAGIIFELLLGGFAALVWLNTSDGVVHTLAYYILAISAINTILINGNPFIRYDGYYLLMDLVGVDNLQRRSSEYNKVLIRKTLFGIETPNAPQGNLFLAIFGISAFIYRFFLYTSIIMVVYYQFTKVVGLVLVIIEIYLLILRPIITEVKTIFKMKNNINSIHALMTVSSCAILIAVLSIPLPWDISLPCEVKPKESQVIYAQESGTVAKIFYKSGSTVNNGQPLFQLENKFLDIDQNKEAVSYKIARVELDQLTSDAKRLSDRNIKLQQLKSIKDSISEFERKKRNLTIKSPLHGTFTMNDNIDYLGKWIEAGEPVAEVFQPDSVTIHAFVVEESIALLSIGDPAKITIEGDVDSFNGIISAINPVAVSDIPHSPLLNVFGGQLPVTQSEGGFKLSTPHYLITVDVKGESNSLQPSRTGIVQVKKRYSILANTWRTISNILHKESTF